MDGIDNVLVLHEEASWDHQMETFSALLALCVGNSPVTGEFPSQRPVTQSFDVFLGLCMNKQLIANDLKHHRAHYDIIVMNFCSVISVWRN